MVIHDGSFETDDCTDHGGEHDSLTADPLTQDSLTQDSLTHDPLTHDSLTWGTGDSSSTDSTGDGGIGGSGSTDSTDTTGGSGTPGSAGTITVEAGGETRTVDANIDLNQDGTPDAGVVSENGAQILLIDSDGDHHADAAVEFKDGHVVAESERGSDGQWHSSGSGSTGSGTDSTSTTGTDSTGTNGPDTTGTGTAGTAGTDVSPVPSPGELSINLNGTHYDAPAAYDADGDGRPDTAVVVDSDSGLTYVFVDTDGDGTADHAAAYGSDGKVQVTAGSSDGSTWTEDRTIDTNFPSTLPSGAVGTSLNDLPSTPETTSEGTAANGTSGSGASGMGTTGSTGSYVVDPQTGQWTGN